MCQRAARLAGSTAKGRATGKEGRVLTEKDIWRSGVYEIKSRNLLVGAYDGEQGFVGIREKFGDEYLFTEYLTRELGGTKIPFDTVTPVRYLAMLDESIPIKPYLGSACDICGKRAWFVQDPQIQSGWTHGWWECEGRCFVEGETMSRAVHNQMLFDILRELEQPIRDRLEAEYPKIVPPWRQADTAPGKTPDVFTGLKGNHPMADREEK
jgi:hypothetical protein